MFIRRDSHVPPLLLLYVGPYTVLRRFLHHFILQIGDKTDKVSTLQLKPCSDSKAPPPHCPLPGCPQGTFRLAQRKGAAAGTVSSWSAAKGFCTPCRHSNPNSSPAST
jgi:hypothetical protein